MSSRQLRSWTAVGRCAALCAVALAPYCLPGCSGRRRATAEVVGRDDPSYKIPNIRKATRARETQTARQLVRDLESDDPAVRFYAIRGLRDLTGETFGYVYYADDRHRTLAVQRWKQWLSGADGPAGAVAADRQQDAGPAEPAADGPRGPEVQTAQDGQPPGPGRP